jgi:hypothetical protein
LAKNEDVTMGKYILRSMGRLSNTEYFRVFLWGAEQDYLCFSGTILECESWLRMKEAGYFEV